MINAAAALFVAFATVILCYVALSVAVVWLLAIGDRRK